VGANNNIVWWKRWLSYWTEIHVESVRSDYNPHLYVSIMDGRYQLSTANAIYSYEDLYSNFYRTFQQIELPPLGANVLLLGFGLGSIPLMLEREFDRQYQYTAVEIDESVLYLAGKYIISHLQSSITTIEADAYAYVLQADEQYDLICMDVFLDQTTAEHFRSTPYVEQLRDLCKENGRVLYNCFTLGDTNRMQAETFFQQIFKRIFPKAVYFQVGGNWILSSRP
jgi:spermidine synthase